MPTRHGVDQVGRTRVFTLAGVTALCAASPCHARGIIAGQGAGLYLFDQTFPNNTIW